MPYVVVVDTREPAAFIDAMRAAFAGAPHARIEVRPLHAGDVLVGAELVDADADARTRAAAVAAAVAGEPLAPMEALELVERKTVRDLAASVMSGHLHQQKTRMREFARQTGARLALLVEQSYAHVYAPGAKGVWYRTPTGQKLFAASSLRTTLENAQQRDGMALYRCDAPAPRDAAAAPHDAVVESAAALRRLVDRLAAARIESPTARADYVDRRGDTDVAVRRAANVTPASVAVAALRAVPGVSAPMARCIVERYATLAELVRALDGAAEPAALLAESVELERRLKSGARQRVGGEVSRRVHHLVTGEPLAEPTKRRRAK